MAHSWAPRTMRKKPSSPQSRPQLLATVQNLVLFNEKKKEMKLMRQRETHRRERKREKNKPVFNTPADDLDSVCTCNAALDVLVDAGVVRVEVLKDEHHALDGAVLHDLHLHRLLADKRLGRRAVEPVAAPVASRPAHTLAHTLGCFTLLFLIHNNGEHSVDEKRNGEERERQKQTETL